MSFSHGLHKEGGNPLSAGKAMKKWDCRKFVLWGIPNLKCLIDTTSLGLGMMEKGHQESQNHGIIKVGKNLQSHLWTNITIPTKLCHQVPLLLIFWTFQNVQKLSTFKILKKNSQIFRNDASNISLGNLFHCLIALSVMKLFLLSNLKLHWHNFPLSSEIQACVWRLESGGSCW